MKARIPNKEFDKGYRKGVRDTVRSLTSCIDMVLLDKHGWTVDQISEFSRQVNELFDSVCRGYVSLNEIEEAHEEEIRAN